MMEEIDIFKVIGAVATIWTALMYVLPPEKAKTLYPVGKILNAIANTPGGLRWK